MLFLRTFLLLFLCTHVAAAQGLIETLASPNEEFDGRFGRAVSAVPDADGDSVPDLLVGAWQETPPDAPFLAGRAYLFSGATGEVLLDLVSPNPTGEGLFGGSVAGVPDTDGDGRGDLLIGASGEGLNAGDAGRAYLFSGATGELLLDLVSPNEQQSGVFGTSVAAVPDADGDGRGDLLIGAPSEDVGDVSAGQAYLFSGATGSVLAELVSPNIRKGSGQFGASVAGIADLDGDGAGDLVVGAPFEDSDGAFNVLTGRAYVFSATGTLLREIDSPTAKPFGLFGNTVASVPDTDGDGRDEVLVGARNENRGSSPTDAGRVHLFSGTTGAVLFTLLSPNEETGGNFGSRVAGVLDLDGDGRGDIVIGAPLEDPGDAPQGAGRAYVFGGAEGTLLFELSSPSEEEGGTFGNAVAGVPDLTGDGRGDLLVGALFEGDAGAQGGPGRVYLFSGTPNTTPTEAGPGVETLTLSVFPNPAADVATLSFSLAAPSEVRLTVYDLLGRTAAVLSGGYAAGDHTARLGTDVLAPGTYVVRLEADGAVQTGRLTVVR